MATDPWPADERTRASIEEQYLRKSSVTIAELIDFLAPRFRAQYGKDCPPWPPDVFAVTATLLRRSGAYVRAVELTKSRPAPTLLEDDWPQTAENLGREWRETFRTTADKRRSRPPAPVCGWWSLLMTAAAEGAPIQDVVANDSLCGAVLRLCLVSDEASGGCGFSEATRGLDGDQFQEWALFRLMVNEFTSLGWEVPRDRACVLPKQHTPQRGLTLRSLSHHLALLPPSDVNVIWHPPIQRAQDRDGDLVNLLLLPWPERVTPENFRVVDEREPGARTLPHPYRFFRFAMRGQSSGAFERKVRAALAAARGCSGHVDGLVFPELGLAWTEYRAAEHVARQEGLLLVAGVRLQPGDLDVPAPTNACLFLVPSSQASRGRRSPHSPRQIREPPVLQRKHHRWCLDRNQILQYGLGGVMPASRDCWELTDIGERRLSFMTLGSWLTLTALICEDLARQDPVSDIVRAVGPNLVIALLMDGPQLKGRWSSRYASVLAEDPGSSVLTLTSLGMAALSQPLPPQPPRNRVVGLWRDVKYGEKELELPPDCTAAVLSLSRDSIEEYSADGRGDHCASHFPVFAGFHPLDLGFERGILPRGSRVREVR